MTKVILIYYQFTTRCTIVHSAVLRLHVVRPSVCLSVCDVGGSGSHKLEILKTNFTDNWPNTFALCSRNAIHLLPEEHWEIWGRLEVGGKKWRAIHNTVVVVLKRKMFLTMTTLFIVAMASTGDADTTIGDARP